MNRKIGLDLYRCLAIIPVVVGHGLVLLEPVNTAFPWVPLPDGVELFFVLSGFLIGQILLDTDFSQVSGQNGLRHFWVRRWMRTLPNYYLFLLLNLSLAWWAILPPDQVGFFSWRFLLFLHNLHEPFKGFFWESWSLAVEEWFYMFFPSLLFFISLFISKINHRRWVFLAGELLLLAVPSALRAWYFHEHPDISGFDWDITIRKLTIHRLDAIGYGVFFAYIKKYHPWNTDTAYRLLGLSILMYVMDVYWEKDIYEHTVFRYPYLNLCYALALPFADTIKRLPFSRAITLTSKVSYSMYLVNLLLVQILTYNIVVKDLSPTLAIGLYLAYFVGVYLVSYIIYWYFELFFLKLRDKLYL